MLIISVVSILKVFFFKDLREPHSWFPEARALKRKIIYHRGPTNSGKTYTALMELEKAKNGIYCSPLRLMAWEVNSRNIYEVCNTLSRSKKNWNPKGFLAH